ncbi:MAG TPA: GAF domain-containing protein [Deltaproteobacteria bacterium]|nr:GAF domain-containing protein [Deltaproteobacteria bacterium]
MQRKKKRKYVQLTDNDEINRLLNTVVSSVKDFTESQFEQIRRLTQIGAALSAESNIERLLEMILEEAKRFTNADGGTLYIMSDDEKRLHFAIVETDSLNVRMGGLSGEITWPPVELYNENGDPNYANVSSYSALSGNVVNIADVYNIDEYNFEGTRQYDAETGYRSQSMLVIPMRNHENDIIGILQLINARDRENGGTIPFSLFSQELTESLASQAAIALTKNRLIMDLQNLFESFIKTIATAIDEKSPYTGDHGRRVVELTMMIAEEINEMNHGPFESVFFNKDQMNELRIAAWLHDVGKVAIPEYVMDKSTKLTTVHDRIDLLRTRIEVLKRDIENDVLRKELARRGGYNEESLINRCRHKINNLEDDYEFLASVNGGVECMTDDQVMRLTKIGRKSWMVNGKKQSLLTEDEMRNLVIRRGTLTDEERAIVNNHAAITSRMLSQMPFPKKLKNIPCYAGSHHECLNGRGYPLGLKAEDIPIQSRILALADVFEALTASDRPYRRGNTLSQAVSILECMVRDDHLDADLFDLFINRKIHLDYAKKELSQHQIDERDGR